MLEPTSSVTNAGPPDRATSARRAAPAPAFSLSLAQGDVPAAPPADVLRALDRAAQVAAELRERQLHVGFDVGADGRVGVKVVDAGGAVLQEIPVARALDLLSGDGPVTILDEVGRR